MVNEGTFHNLDVAGTLQIQRKVERIRVVQAADRIVADAWIGDHNRGQAVTVDFSDRLVERSRLERRPLLV